MPYIHPKRALGTADVLDPQEMNADVQPAAEKVSGRLNGHDFTGAPMKANAAVASRAYYSIGHVFKSVHPGYVDNAGPPLPAGAGPDAAFTLLSDGVWHTVDDMSVTMTTGVSSLWIIAWIQYSWHTWPHGSPLYLQAGVQFALAVDGRVIDATITGKKEGHERTWVPGRPTEPWNDATPTAFPGPGVLKPGQTPGGMGPHHAAVRVGCSHPVSPGSHTIQLVARRASRVGNPFSSTDYIVGYSRRLFVLEAPQFPRATSTLSTVDVPGLEPEDALSAAVMSTNRVAPLRTAYNAVQHGMVARGAFMNAHLSSTVRASDITTFGPAVSQTTNDDYPGYGVNTFAGAQMGGAGWWELNDGAGGQLRVTNGGAGWNRANGTIILLGNVNVQRVRNAAGPPVGEFHSFGVLTLGYLAGGARTVIAATEAGSNSANILEDDVAGNRQDWGINADVPFMFIHEPTDTVLPAGVITHFTVFGSTLWGDPSGGVINMTWGPASLICIQLRD